MTLERADQTLPPARAARRTAKKTRRTLAKTNVKPRPCWVSALGWRPRTAKRAVSLLSRPWNRWNLRNPYPDWVCAALS